MSSSREIKSGAIISYIAIFFNIIAGLIYTPWMVRQIGVSDYGLFTLISAFLSYFLVDFGMGSAIARFIAKFRAENKVNKVNNMLGVTTRIYLLIDLAIIITLAVVYFFLSNIFLELSQGEIDKFKVIYLIAGFFSVVSFPLTPVDGAMIAYERFFVLKMTGLVQKVLIIILMIFALLTGHGLFTLIFVNGIVGFGVKLFKFLYIRKQVDLKINIQFFDKTMAKELLSFSSWIFVIGIAQRLLLNIVPTILGILSGSQQIAIFAIANTLEGYTWIFAQALNGLFLPKVTRMVAVNDNRTEVTNLMIKVGRMQLMITGLLITGIVVLGKSFVNLWMGDVFLDSYYVVLFLILPGIITLTQEIAMTLLFVVDEIKYRAFLFIFALIISVIIGISLAPKFGALGTAIGVGSALLICHVIGMNVVYSKVLKLEIVRFFKSVHLKMFWSLLVSGILSYLGQQLYEINSWISFLISGLVFVLLYSILMWNFVMNKDEKGLVLSVKNKFKR